jgi:hypothetical protein
VYWAAGLLPVSLGLWGSALLSRLLDCDSPCSHQSWKVSSAPFPSPSGTHPLQSPLSGLWELAPVLSCFVLAFQMPLAQGPPAPPAFSKRQPSQSSTYVFTNGFLHSLT